jgi:uncharacterized protein
LSNLYVDTSAIGRVLLGEPDAKPIRDELARYPRHVSSALLRIELRRLGMREGRLPDADRLLTGISLIPLDVAVLSAAETIAPPGVGTLDAIHLVTALRLAAEGDVSAILTFDRQLIAAAGLHGLDVISPD